MAAETASLPMAIDRDLYARLLTESLLRGEPECDSDWRRRGRVRGMLITDAKSLFDHLHKKGSIPQERQTLIDLKKRIP